MAPTRYIFHYRFRVQYSSYLHTRQEPQELRLGAEAEQNSTNKIFNVFPNARSQQEDKITVFRATLGLRCISLFCCPS